MRNRLDHRAQSPTAKPDNALPWTGGIRYRSLRLGSATACRDQALRGNNLIFETACDTLRSYIGKILKTLWPDDKGQILPVGIVQLENCFQSRPSQINAVVFSNLIVFPSH